MHISLSPLKIRDETTWFSLSHLTFKNLFKSIQNEMQLNKALYFSQEMWELRGSARPGLTADDQIKKKKEKELQDLSWKILKHLQSPRHLQKDLWVLLYHTAK